MKLSPTVIAIAALAALAAFIMIILSVSKKEGQQFPADSPRPTIQALNATSSAVLGVQAKTSDCVAANGLPDKACTPGATFPDATTEQICQPGYSKSVRNVPQATKDAVFAEYNVVTHAPGQYEVDHLISLELGGSNDIANLFPEAAEPRPGFHEKDRLENFLHDQVCSGKMSLQDAQKAISDNWLQVYQTAGF